MGGSVDVDSGSAVRMPTVASRPSLKRANARPILALTRDANTAAPPPSGRVISSGAGHPSDVCALSSEIDFPRFTSPTPILPAYHRRTCQACFSHEASWVRCQSLRLLCDSPPLGHSFRGAAQRLLLDAGGHLVIVHSSIRNWASCLPVPRRHGWSDLRLLCRQQNLHISSWHRDSPANT